MKPEIFIGSSREGLEIAHAIQAKSDYKFKVNIWTDGILILGIRPCMI
jgi:predicted nucleotide-binding protein